MVAKTAALPSRKFVAYWRLMRFNSLAVVMLLYWPGLWSLFVASGGVPPLWLAAWFLIGAFVMSALGCVLNDYADRDVDALVDRTKSRPLVSGEILPNEALGLAVLLGAAAMGLLMALNSATFWLAMAGAMLVLTYPFTKRVFAIPQLYLAFAYSFAVPMAFCAVLGEVPAEGWALYLANFFWVLAYDTTYAIADKPDDLKVGIYTSPIFFGKHDVAAVMTFHALFIASLALVGHFMLDAGPWLYAGLAVAAVMMAAQYPRIKDRNRPNCTKSFLFNQWIGMAIAAGFALNFCPPGSWL